MLEIIKLIIGPVTGAAIALIVNRLFEIRNKKPLIVFSFDQAFDVSSEVRAVRTNHSGYQIICYNIGQVPVFIQNIEVYKYKSFHKKDFLLDIFPTQKMETKSLLPFSTMKIDLSNSEIDNIIWHCKENNLDKLNIIAYGVGNKQYKGYIDLWWVKDIDNDYNNKIEIEGDKNHGNKKTSIENCENKGYPKESHRKESDTKSKTTSQNKRALMFTTLSLL